MHNADVIAAADQCLQTLSPTRGYENRSVAARIPSSNAKNQRIEYRVGGADANPYLALASLMASIHWGLKQALQPSPPTEELSTEAVGLPTDLRGALRLTETSEVLKDYLGEDFIPVYCAQKHSEIDAFENAISARISTLILIKYFILIILIILIKITTMLASEKRT